MKLKYKVKEAKEKKKKRSVDWRKYLIWLMLVMLIANFGWDTYNRVPEVKLYYQKIEKYVNMYYDKIHNKINSLRKE